jgi:hypothetical protein
VLIALALAAQILAPRIIDLKSVRNKIQTALSDAIGGTVTFDRLDVAILPRPSAQVARLRISVPGTLEGTIDSLKIYPRILPLFTGKFRVAKAIVDTPDFAVRFAAMPAEKPQYQPPETLAALKKSIIDSGTRLAALAPNLVADIRHGRITLSIVQHPLVTVERLDARIVLPPRGFSVQVACGSSLWNDLALDAQLDPQTLFAEGLLKVRGLKPHLLNPFFFPNRRSPVGDSLVSLDLSFRTDGTRYLQATGSGSAPQLLFLRKGRALQVEQARFRGTLEINERNASVVLNNLEAASPRFSLQGKLSTEFTKQGAGIAVTGRNIDIHELRHAVLFFAKDVKTVSVIFNILRAGIVPVITFEFSGASLSDLSNLKQIRITSTLQNGIVYIPGTPLRLTDVRGRAVIAQGMLQAEELSARMGNTATQQGTLRLGLMGGSAPFHLDTMLYADLRELPPILKAFITDPGFANELSQFRDINGTAQGRLMIGESLRSLTITADISKFYFTAGYQRIPFPVQVKGGKFLLKGNNLSLKNVHGTLGKSTLDELTARLSLADQRIEIASADVSLNLDELYQWLSTYPTATQALNGIGSVQGFVKLMVQHANIPLSEPRSTQFNAAGNVSDLTISMKDLPGPVIVSRGSFTVDNNTLAFSNVFAKLSDASLYGDCRLDDYLHSADKGEFTVSGKLGNNSVNWLGRLLHIPPEFNVRTPVTLSQIHLSWKGRDNLACTGMITFPKGPSVMLDFFHSPETFAINTLRIRDNNDQIDGRMKFEQRKLDFSVAGSFRENTLMKVFSNERFNNGRLSGNLEAHISLDRPWESTARGTLEGERFPLPRFPGFKVPAVIDHIVLRADDRKISVTAANISMGSTHAGFTGTATAVDDGYTIDGNLSVDRLDLDAFPAMADESPATDSNQTVQRKSSIDAITFPLHGTVQFKADFVTSGGLTAGPVIADISLNSSGFSAVINEAALCGLSITGSAAVSGDETALDLQAVAAGQELESTMTCLTKDSIRTTGVFDLKLDLKARGQKQALIDTIGGTVEFSATNGKINRAEKLMRILALLNVTELLRGKVPDMGKEGIAYKTMLLQGKVHNGALQVSEAVLDGSTITISGTGTVNLPAKSIDVMLLVAPFKTFDAIIKAIPGVRYIMGGNLIAVPVRIQGPFEEPKIEVMKPADVGDQLMGLTTRVLKLPFKIVEPVLPGESPKKP